MDNIEFGVKNSIVKIKYLFEITFFILHGLFVIQTKKEKHNFLTSPNIFEK